MRRKGKRQWVYLNYDSAIEGYKSLHDTAKRYRLYAFDVPPFTYYVWARGPLYACSRLAVYLEIGVWISYNL